jgi:YD repeat-containing protein
MDMRRSKPFNHANGMAGFICCSLFALLTQSYDALAQGYPGANLNSVHPLDYCQIQYYDQGGFSLGKFISPVTSVADALTESCANEVAGNRYFYWTTACTPILTPGTFSDAGFQTQNGGWDEPFVGAGTRIRRDDGAVVQFVNLGSCGCTVSGPVSGFAGVGTDAKCYCEAGYDWSSTAHACLPPKYHLSVTLPKPMQRGPTNNCSGDPINPATGAVFDTVIDVRVSRECSFKHTYNSTDMDNTDMSSGWRHSYSRKIAAKYTTIEQEHFVSSASTSSEYDTPVDACQRGFAEIQSNVTGWVDAYTIWSGSNCQVFRPNGALIGFTTVYSSASFAPSPVSSSVAYDLIRDDGQVLRFAINQGNIISAAGYATKLQKNQAGFTVTDSSDNVEQYDANGKLLTVTSRSGLVQTMSYDGSDRLSGVSDSFGHQLILNYDAQGHLSTVTRQ